ncbi:hypothetical protein Tco_0528380 [Tanacetum coccineum]
MLSIGILLPPEHLEVLEENLDWEDIQWLETGVWISIYVSNYEPFDAFKVGDPLDKAAIEGIDWSYKSNEKAMPNTGVGGSVELKWKDGATLDEFKAAHLNIAAASNKICLQDKKMVAAASNAILILSLKTNSRVQENVTFLRNIILDDRVPTNKLKFLFRSLNNLGSLLEKGDKLKEV